MATVHQRLPTAPRCLTGAPEEVLARCRPGAGRDRLEAAVGGIARSGLRVLALATAATEDVDAIGLDPLGLVAFHDPLRPSTIEAVARCRRAGIRVTLVTGDHLATAQAVGWRPGSIPSRPSRGADLAALAPGDRGDVLRAASIVARVDPATKVELVAATGPSERWWP